MTSYTKKVITDMLVKVTVNLAAKYTRIKEGVTEIMFGHVLDHEAKHILNEGICQGREEGREQTYYKLVSEGILDIERASKDLNLSLEEIEANMEKSGYQFPNKDKE